MSDAVQIEVTEAELEIVKESLRQSKRAKEAYAGYPDPEFKAQEIEVIDAVLKKLSVARSRSG